MVKFWATNIDKIDFYGPFDLEIGKSFAGNSVDSNTPADKQVKSTRNHFGIRKVGQLQYLISKLGSSGELLSKS